MPEDSIKYRLVNIHLENGFKKTVLLNKHEILSLYSAYLDREDSPIYVFYYDGSNADKLSGILDLRTVQFIDLDDKELEYKDLVLLNYAKLRIWTPPSFFRKLRYEIMWYYQKLFKKEVK